MGETADTGRALRFEVQTGAGALAHREAGWEGLAWAGPGAPTNDPCWQRLLWQAVGGGAGELHVHHLLEGDRLRGVFPLGRSRGPLGGWFALADPRLTPYTSFALDGSGADLAEPLLEQTLASAPLLDLQRLHVLEPFGEALLAAATARGLRVDARTQGGDTVLELPSSFDDLRAALPTRLRKNTERAIRQLERQGRLELCVLRGAEGIEEAVSDCFELETHGWKSERGWTVRTHPQMLAFYVELARGSARAGRLALYQLRLDGRLLAYDYCLRAQGHLNLLKTSYEPDWSRHSPSNVLRWLVLEHEVKEGEVGLYHFGDPSAWKLRWTDDVRPLQRVRIYAPGARGLAAYTAGPVARGLASRWLAPARRRLARGRRRGRAPRGSPQRR